MTSQLLAHFYLLELFVLASTDVYLLNPVQGSLSNMHTAQFFPDCGLESGWWKVEDAPSVTFLPIMYIL